MIEMAIVVTVILVLAGLAVPIFSSITRNMRGDGEMQSLRTAVVQAKMRAAATFSRARVRADTTERTFQLELWNKSTSQWSLEGGVESLPANVNYGYGAILAAPPNTQTSISQAAVCKNGAGTTIANTACLIFNSRGIPIDSTGTALTASDAIYINDGASAYAITVGRTGLIQGWRRDLTGNSTWKGR